MSAPMKITDLPLELQKTIISHVAQRDLCALCLVSKHFHALALAQLYRKLAIMFPFEEGPFCQAHEAPAQLDAIVTSTHESARYLKEVVVDAHKTGPPSVDRTYIDSPCALSCGKYLSTLLLLTLRRAKALESFCWNVRMVLNRNVLEQLHSMSSLRKLHLRLQTRPPPRSAGNVVLVAEGGNGPNSFHSPLQGTGAGAASGSVDKAGDAGGAKSSLAKPFLSFAGFKHLTSLAVLDIDTLDYIPDIASCIRNCSSTLEHFHISLSESMAKRATSPPPDQSVASETDEDDFGVPLAPLPPPPPPPGLDASGLPALSNELSAGAELKAQEQIMDKLFGLGLAESAALTHGQKGASSKAAPSAGAPGKISMPELAVFKSCVEKFLAIFKKFLDASEKGNWSEFQAEKPLWDLIQKVAQTTDGASGAATIGALANGGLLGAGNSGSSGSASTSAGGGGQAGAVSTLNTLLALGKVSAADQSEGGGGVGGGSAGGAAESASVQESQGAQKASAAADVPQPMQIEPPSRSKTKVMASKNDDLLPEDINIDYPDADESAVDDPEPMEGMVNGEAASQSGDQPQASSSGDALNGAVGDDANAAVAGDDGASGKRTGGPLGNAADTAEESASHKAAATPTGAHGKAPADKRPLADKAAAAAPQQQQQSGADAVKEYVRATRKLSLRTLRVYLVPLRAAALHRGVETTHLQHISLLNVGPQGAFWRQLLAAGRTAPLQLRSVHTDDVTAAFVALAASLPALAELYLLKRSRRFRAMQPLAEPSAVGMRDIRRRILRRHAGTLRRLKIQNNNDRAWDADEKTVVLLAEKGRRLSELGLSLALSDFHLLLQLLPRFSNLRALHILKCRQDSSSLIWPFKALVGFVIDCVANHPYMTLQYVAGDGTVAGLARRTVGVAASGKGKGKAKQKQSQQPQAAHSAAAAAAATTTSIAPSALSASSTAATAAATVAVAAAAAAAETTITIVDGSGGAVAGNSAANSANNVNSSNTNTAGAHSNDAAAAAAAAADDDEDDDASDSGASSDHHHQHHHAHDHSEDDEEDDEDDEDDDDDDDDGHDDAGMGTPPFPSNNNNNNNIPSASYTTPAFPFLPSSVSGAGGAGAGATTTTMMTLAPPPLSAPAYKIEARYCDFSDALGIEIFKKDILAGKL